MDLSTRNKWIYPGFKFNSRNMREFQITSMILLDEIFRPIVKKEELNLDFRHWRYHMRSMNDVHGTNVKLILYTNENNFDAIKYFMEEKSNKISPFLSTKVGFADCKDQGETDRYYRIEGSSDRFWPDALQKSFPIYIQGVCETFLAILEEVKKQSSIDKSNDYIGYYQDLYESIKVIWIKSGWHTFCHHLGASFFYEQTLFGGTFLVSL